LILLNNKIPPILKAFFRS